MFGRRAKTAGTKTAGTKIAGAQTARAKRDQDRPRTPPKVDVYYSVEDGGRWQIGCDELLVKWDVESGHEAEQIIRQLLAEQVPQLLGELEFDSYPEAFFASTVSESTARAVAALIRQR